MLSSIVEVENKNNLTVFVYGKSGTGKTIFACGFPAPVLVIDCDNRMLSVKETDVLSVDQKKQVYAVSIKETFFKENNLNSRAVPTAYKQVERVFNELAATGAYDGVVPATIVLDSMTTFGEFALDDSMQSMGHLGQVKVSQPDWGGQIRRMQKIILLAKSFTNMNFVCTAHEKYMKDKDGNILSILPSLTGQFASSVILYFDEIYHTKASPGPGGSIDYRLETKATYLITARSSLGLLPEVPTGYKNIMPDKKVLDKK